MRDPYSYRHREKKEGTYNVHPQNSGKDIRRDEIVHKKDFGCGQNNK